MNPSVISTHEDDEFWISENCYVLERSNVKDDPDVSIARARVLPGETTRWHRVVETVERYYILEGNGLVEVGDELKQVVKPGDVVLIPASMPQRITNNGDKDLIFLAICSPRYLPEAYEDLEVAMS